MRDFTLPDQAARPWSLSSQGTAVLLVFLRGDW